LLAHSELNVRLLVRQPLCGESRPLERTPVEHVVEEDRVLFPDLVLFVDLLVALLQLQILATARAVLLAHVLVHGGCVIFGVSVLGNGRCASAQRCRSVSSPNLGKLWSQSALLPRFVTALANRACPDRLRIAGATRVIDIAAGRHCVAPWRLCMISSSPRCVLLLFEDPSVENNPLYCLPLRPQRCCAFFLLLPTPLPLASATHAQRPRLSPPRIATPSLDSSSNHGCSQVLQMDVRAVPGHLPAHC
jgi:hypothetical protein